VNKRVHNQLRKLERLINTQARNGVDDYKISTTVKINKLYGK
jgi:hypothetical protein